MAWVRISDDFYDHPKMADLTPMALGLWVTALAWCNRNLTDGHVPERAARRLVDFDGLTFVGSEYGLDEAVAELKAADAWEDDTITGWRVVDYLDYQPSAERVRAERTRNAQRQQEWRDKNKARSNTVTNSGVTVAPTPTPTQEKKASATAAASADFERFWSIYPKRKGKTAAAKAFTKALQRTDVATIAAALHAQLPEWRADASFPQYVPLAATWLNGDRWTDEVATLPGVPPLAAGGRPSYDLPPLPEPPDHIRDAGGRAYTDWAKGVRAEQRAAQDGAA